MSHARKGGDHRWPGSRDDDRLLGPPRPLRVAVVGSGPAGFYAAAHLLRNGAEVDIIERLPTPYGLVRGGVAPDHPKIKSVSRVYDKTAAKAGFRFIGNVELGRDVELDELRARYDKVVLAVGNEASRRLGIPGEGISRCIPAAVIVGWYNGHPDYRRARIDLRGRRLAVVGNGNVAIDIARILGSNPEALARTDIAASALARLAGSGVREVIVLGRRGPLQAAFTPAELKELLGLEGTSLRVDPEDLEGIPDSDGPLSAAGRNLDLLRAASARSSDAPRRIHLRFRLSPEAILAGEDGGVRGLRLRHNRLVASDGGRIRAVPTECTEELACELVVVAVGYRGRPIGGVPFDADRGVIPNEGGRVLAGPGGEPAGDLYVVGWARSGPRGLIGAHRAASREVVNRLLRDVAEAGGPTADLPGREELPALLRERGVRPVSFEDWRRLDEVEVARGRRRRAPRDKITEVEGMLSVLDEPPVR